MTPAPDLDALVAAAAADADSADPLDRLATAAAMAVDLAGLADQLVGHYVEEARRAGTSWADIGAEIGVTKQAAQQRQRVRGRRHERGAGDGFPGRFRLATDHFKGAMDAALAAAAGRDHDAVGTEHLLLGLLAGPESAGAEALSGLGIAQDAVGRRVDAARRPTSRPTIAGPRFTPRAKKVLHHAHRIARRERCRFLGTEHVVLALAEGEGLGPDILRELGVTPESARAEVRRIWGRAS